MPCKIPFVVLDYLELVENGIACNRQKAMAKLVRNVFDNDDVYVDEEKLEKYLSLEKYLPFSLFPWEKFILCMWNCVYRSEDNTPRFDTVFSMLGRGAGKDGYIAFDSMCSISPFNPVEHCDVDICANNEEQATRPMKDLIEILENPLHEKRLKGHFYHTKEIVQGIRNKGEMKGRTNNPKGRDGMRSGKIIFNEVHQYEDYRNIEVFTSSLGKRAESRTGFFTSNGYVSDGVLDSYLALCDEILFEGKEDGGFLPFIFCLDDEAEAHDPNMWQKANPSLPYLPNLRKEIAREYERWKDRPEENMDFMTKRMNLRVGVTDLMVTSYENIKRTNKPLPDLRNWECVVGIDFALLNDWCGVNFHFRKGEERYDINHAFICSNGRDLPYIKAPWQEWAELGLVTVVDSPVMAPDDICNYIANMQMKNKWRIKKIAIDSFRVAMFGDSLRKIGFDIKDRNKVMLIRPSDIMQAAVKIDFCFEKDLLTWGDQPHLRWATNNTKRIRKKQGADDMGNFFYGKIESKTRKTDSFMAFVASMCCEDVLKDGGAKILRPLIGAVTI